MHTIDQRFITTLFFPDHIHIISLLWSSLVYIIKLYNFLEKRVCSEFEQIIFVIGQGHIRPNKIIFVRSMIMHLPWPYYAYICYKNCLNVYGVQWHWFKFLDQRWRSQQIFIKSNFGGHVTLQLLTSAVFYNILSPDIDLLSNSYFS